MKKQRGFTIVEMMVSLTLMALLLGVVAVNFHGPRGRSDSKGAAVVLASALRQARQQAISQGRPVAVAFASDNGTRAHSSGFYQLVGETKPRVVTRTSFTSEYGGVGVFCGSYDGPSWTTSYPATLNTENFALGTWLPPYPQDHMVAFLPNGLAVSDLPLGDGAYRLVVAKSFRYSGSPATLSTAQEPRTVSVRPTGEVTEDAQVPGSTSLALAVGDQGDGAALPVIHSTSNAAPQLVTPFLKLNPDANADLLAMAPAGSTATVPPNGMLTFTVYATDPDGDQLWCKWAGPGTFSSAEGARMVWNESEKRWVGEWSWRVPRGAKVGDTYTLSCTVYDNHGGVTSPVDVGLTMPKPAVISGQSLLCAMLDGAYRWNWDGTGAKRLVRREDVGNKPITKARWSPDYSTVAIVAGNEVYLCTPEGQNLQLLFSYPNPVDALCWDRDGLKLYVITNDRLHSLLPDPTLTISPDQTLSPALGLDRPSSLSMHPSAKLLLTSDYSSSQMMTIWLPDPAANNGPVAFSRVADTLGDEIHNPIFDQGGGTLYFRCREPEVSGLCSIKAPAVVDANARTFTFSSSGTSILNGVGSGSGYTVSPDGRYIAGGLAGDRVAICPVTGTSLADTIDVTAVPTDQGRRVVDIDWGYY